MKIETTTFMGREYLASIDGYEVVDCLRVEQYRPLLDNLREYWPAEKLPRGMRRMREKLCFDNAMSTWRNHGLRYAEGFVLCEIGHLINWIHHAWNLDADDHVIDRTLRPGEGQRYLGTVLEGDDLLAWFYRDAR